jgi:hypothetical protein
MLSRRDPEGRSVKANGAVMMAGGLARVVPKARMMNGSKDMRESRTSWLHGTTDAIGERSAAVGAARRYISCSRILEPEGAQ